jgi:hypothetical protein
MPTRRPYLRVAAAVVAALIGASAVASQPAWSARPPAGFKLPAGAPTPGTGFRLLSAYKVVIGYQIYSCVTAADGTSAWSTPTSTPEAFLRRYHSRRTIHHHGGPRWTSTSDGSTIVGAVDQRVPKDGTIPWLLLRVTAHELSAPGHELHDVTHISRVNTTGGVGPTGACDPVTEATRWVAYGADYVFWVPA